MASHEQVQKNLNDVVQAWGQFQATADTHLPRSRGKITDLRYAYSPKRSY